MPINKAAQFRFEIIDECLRNTRKKWSKAELLNYVNRRLELHYGDEISISASQLRYDLGNMQSEYGAPIEMYKEGRAYYYQYEDASFSIRNVPVEEEDIIKLNSAIKLLQQIKGFTIADDMADVVQRLEMRYNFKIETESNIISFENSAVIKGTEYLEDLYKAIIRKNVLKISYHSFHAAGNRIWQVHPYFLKQFDNRWYLLGYCQEKESTGLYALDRIVDVKVIRTDYLPPAFLNCEEYFQDLIGVTILPGRSEIYDIELLFTPALAPYILSKPLHHSQKILNKMNDGSLSVQIKVMINPELIKMLLSYGRDVKVISPQALVHEIYTIIEQLTAKYHIAT